MNTTLAPVFNALGYHGAARQRGMVKLLQASGAFGELPGVSAVLDDQKAQAVLDAVTFPTPERAARWLHDVTQAHMLRPAGTERHQCEDSPFFTQHRPELVTALQTTGMLGEVKPARKHYDHVLVLGAMQGGLENRLDTLGKLWEEGVRFGQVHLLGSERALVPGREPIASIPGANGATLSTEMQMMQALYYDKINRWPQEMRQVPVFAVNTPNKANGARANTRDTLEAWVGAGPPPGDVLVISSQPYVQYQDAVAKAALPPSFRVETVGASAGQVNIGVALDSLARRIDAGFAQLLETLKQQKPAPPPQLALLDPALIQVDAATYQFRSGGDGAGVTEKGRYRAEKWDAILHGEPLLVHAKRDGTLFVADGHHRLDLAKRLNAQGTGPGRVAAQVLREADGYTARDVKIIAAYKNIAHGQTDPVDTARVLQQAQAVDHPQWLPSLQMDKDNLRMAVTLSHLCGPALEYVAQGEVPVEAGVRVAERVADPAQQETVMRVLSEKLRLIYNPATHTHQALLPMESWPPAIVIKPEKREALPPAEVKTENHWVKTVNRQRSAIALSGLMH